MSEESPELTTPVEASADPLRHSSQVVEELFRQAEQTARRTSELLAEAESVRREAEAEVASFRAAAAAEREAATREAEELARQRETLRSEMDEMRTRSLRVAELLEQQAQSLRGIARELDGHAGDHTSVGPRQAETIEGMGAPTAGEAEAAGPAENTVQLSVRGLQNVPTVVRLKHALNSLDSVTKLHSTYFADGVLNLSVVTTDSEQEFADKLSQVDSLNLRPLVVEPGRIEMAL